jgi:hypothetical protein
MNEDEYLIAEPTLGLLNQLGLGYEVLGTEGFDSAIGKIREMTPAQV